MSDTDKATMRADIEARTNRLVQRYHNQAVFLDEVATEMGWTREDAGLVMLWAYNNRCCNVSLATFHGDHGALTHRPIDAGFPDLPIQCLVCGKTITEKRDLMYDFVLHDIGVDHE